MTRATTEATIDAVNDALAWHASMIRHDMNVLRYGEMDECVRKMAGSEGDGEAEKSEAEEGKMMRRGARAGRCTVAMVTRAWRRRRQCK